MAAHCSPFSTQINSLVADAWKIRFVNFGHEPWNKSGDTLKNGHFSSSKVAFVIDRSEPKPKSV
jgi:hypothetical protein